MPVVIKELVITAAVEPTVALAPGNDLASEEVHTPPDDPAGPLPRLVQACVEQVLAVLREQAER
jgi:hypothetical protein